MTKLCLCMIVKNESARIERALASVAPYITAAVILDTGSTDDTKDRIRKFFVDRPHIKCWIKDGPFENFSQARNLALAAAHLYRSSHNAHYFLLMDADMELRVTRPDAFEGLDGPSYTMIQVAGGVSYPNTRLLHTRTEGRYIGATHEYLDVPTAGTIDGADFIDHADGSNRANKFERDIELLLADIEKDPENPRSWFYLANSYRDAGMWHQAEQAYKKRIELGDWDEEVWNAEINLAACLKEQQSIEAGFTYTALSAYNRRPQRAEALYDLTKHYREKPDCQKTALIFCKAGLHLKRPDDTLFVADWVYDWGFREEFSILGFYGDDADKKLAARVCSGLGLDLSVPAQVRHGARQNLRWYLRPLAEHCPSFKSREIHATPQPDYVAMNPSVALHNGELHCIVRTVNYTIDGDGRYLIKGEGEPNGSNPIDTKNLLLRLNADLSTASQQPIIWEAPLDPQFTLVRGLEDMRLFSWKDELWATACVREYLASGTPVQALVTVTADKPTTFLTDGSACEKNWMPLVDGDDLHYVYRLDTVVAGDVNKLSVSRAPAKIAVDNISGGSQCIPFKNGWLCVVHEAIDPGDYRRIYAHRFAWLSRDYTLRRLSLPFCFHAQQIEFCAGLAPHPNGLDLVLSYGVKDAQAMLAQVSITDVATMLSEFHEN